MSDIKLSHFILLASDAIVDSTQKAKLFKNLPAIPFTGLKSDDYYTIDYFQEIQEGIIVIRLCYGSGNRYSPEVIDKTNLQSLDNPKTKEMAEPVNELIAVIVIKGTAEDGIWISNGKKIRWFVSLLTDVLGLGKQLLSTSRVLVDYEEFISRLKSVQEVELVAVPGSLFGGETDYSKLISNDLGLDAAKRFTLKAELQPDASVSERLKMKLKSFHKDYEENALEKLKITGKDESGMSRVFDMQYITDTRTLHSDTGQDGKSDMKKLQREIKKMDEKRLHYRFNCCSVLIELLEHTFHSKRGICGGDYDSYLCIVWVYCDCDLQPLWTIHYPIITISKEISSSLYVFILMVSLLRCYKQSIILLTILYNEAILENRARSLES